MNLIKIKQEEQEFFERNGIKVVSDGKEWYHLPNWYRKDQDCFFEVTTFEKLPKSVKVIVKGLGGAD